MTEKEPPVPPIIHIRRLTKTYWNGDVAIPAVRGVDLDIEEGDFVSLTGPSGSGKSTLMNLLAFLDAPDSGTYQFGGQDITAFDEDYRAELRNAVIGFVFQQFFLLARTTALDNVAMPLMYAGKKKRQAREQAYDVLQKVSLEHRIYHNPNELSGGQQQRVCIARALVNNPRIIFCDEPTGNLDSKTAKEIMDIFDKLNDEGKTIVMVTHEPSIAKHAKTQLCMKDGKMTEKC
ncbi:MAG: ABC transporter ATP-binding protein [bacterium]|nr:ABC transporter ATP-binding protein [bacterium]